MSRFRSYAPLFVKKITWNWRHRNNDINPAVCPHEVVEYLQTVESPSGILDLGCGTGNLRAALRQRGWNGLFIGVDVSEKVIEVASRSPDANAEWQVVAMEDFPILERKVSTICLCETLYYVKPSFAPELLERCRKSLAPGGRIVVRIWHRDRHDEYISLLLRLGAQDRAPIYVLQA